MIPLCDPQLQYLELKSEIDEAMRRVATSGRYILGPEVQAFEQEMAAYHGCKYAVGVGSGTDALQLALRSLGIGPGDEVVTTPFTFIATSEAIGMVGATPVFVDIDPDTFNLDAQQLEAAISSRIKGILPVHLYGQPCDMDSILAVAACHDLPVIEDCAQATGAEYGGRKVGTLGKVGCLSFFPSKNLGCLGDGGMVLTDDPAVYEQVEMLRRHGGRVKYHHSKLGLNSRLDELQAAILRVKLPHLDRWNSARRKCAFRYNQLLSDFPHLELPKEMSEIGLVSPTMEYSHPVGSRAVYHQYTLQIEDRDAVMQRLKDSQVQSFPYYPVPLHLQEVHQNLGYQLGDFPNAERAATHCLSLPMYPELTASQQQQVVAALQPALARAG